MTREIIPYWPYFSIFKSRLFLKTRYFFPSLNITVTLNANMILKEAKIQKWHLDNLFMIPNPCPKFRTLDKHKCNLKNENWNTVTHTLHLHALRTSSFYLAHRYIACSEIHPHGAKHCSYSQDCTRRSLLVFWRSSHYWSRSQLWIIKAHWQNFPQSPFSGSSEAGPRHFNIHNAHLKKFRLIQESRKTFLFAISTYKPVQITDRIHLPPGIRPGFRG